MTGAQRLSTSAQAGRTPSTNGKRVSTTLHLDLAPGPGAPSRPALTELALSPLAPPPPYRSARPGLPTRLASWRGAWACRFAGMSGKHVLTLCPWLSVCAAPLTGEGSDSDRGAGQGRGRSPGRRGFRAVDWGWHRRRPNKGAGRGPSGTSDRRPDRQLEIRRGASWAPRRCTLAPTIEQCAGRGTCTARRGRELITGLSWGQMSAGANVTERFTLLSRALALAWLATEGHRPAHPQPLALAHNFSRFPHSLSPLRPWPLTTTLFRSTLPPPRLKSSRLTWQR